MTNHTLKISCFLFAFALNATPSFSASVSSDEGIEWVYENPSAKKKSRKKNKKRKLTKQFRVNPTTLKNAVRIPLNIDGELVYAVREKLVSKSHGGFTWLGILETDSDSQVSLYSRDSILIGSVSSSTHELSIKAAGPGLYEFEEEEASEDAHDSCGSAHSDDDETPGDHEDTRSDRLDGTPFASGLSESTGDLKDDTISLMVIYTEEAMWGAVKEHHICGSEIADYCRGITSRYSCDWEFELRPGTDMCDTEYLARNIESEIENEVDKLNQVFRNSWADASIEVVHTHQIKREESSEYDVFDYRKWVREELSSSSKLAKLRDEHQADLVSLWVQKGNGWCGAGYIYNSQISDTHYRRVGANYGVTTVSRKCLSKKTFAHEIGHNLGLRHEPYTDDEEDPFVDGHGWTHPKLKFRTIMSYGAKCKKYGKWCKRITRFSNPDNPYDGKRTGSNARCNNVRVINETWQTIANNKSAHKDALSDSMTLSEKP